MVKKKKEFILLALLYDLILYYFHNFENNGKTQCHKTILNKA